MKRGSELTYSSWLDRNRGELSAMAQNLELTPGWGLWPVEVPHAAANHHVSFFSTWWSERIGGRLAMISLVYPHELSVASQTIAHLSGDQTASPWSRVPGHDGLIAAAKGLGPLDAALVFHDGTGWGGSRKPTGWHLSLQAINWKRDVMIRGLGAPLIWLGPQSMLEATMDSAPDLWSVREIRTTLL